MRIVRAALIAFVTCSACAPYANAAGGVATAYVDTGALERPPHPPLSPADVQVLSIDDTLPPYEELGYVEAFQAFVHGTSASATLDGFLEPLRIEAARQGCNAIVLHDGCVRSFVAGTNVQYSGGALRSTGQTSSDFARIGATCVWIEPTVGGQEPLGEAGQCAPTGSSALASIMTQCPSR